MTNLETIQTTRTIKAIAVPFGHEVEVPQGTEVIVLQALGGSYTVVAGGQTLRVDGVDADALGRLPYDASGYLNDAAVPLEDKIWAQLKTCYDPEVPVNIVDLGLIYSVAIAPFRAVTPLAASDDAAAAANNLEESVTGSTGETKAVTNVEKNEGAVKEDQELVGATGHKVTIHMTLTAPGCGMGPVIIAEAERKVLAIPGVKEVEIMLVFDPPWDRTRLSEAAKLALGMM